MVFIMKRALGQANIVSGSLKDTCVDSCVGSPALTNQKMAIVKLRKSRLWGTLEPLSTHYMHMKGRRYPVLAVTPGVCRCQVVATPNPKTKQRVFTFGKDRSEGSKNMKSLHIQLVSESSRGIVLSTKDTLAANNVLPGSASLVDDAAKSEEIVVTAVKSSRESEDNQLEEGEIPFYQDHDSNCDPNIAFSYIDIKLQNLLGHSQKDFEGEILAENLGSKFGCYGSFLPTHQRSSSVFQRKSPSIVRNTTTQKIPNEAVVEIMTSHHTPGGSLLTPLPDFLLPLLERDEKDFPKEPENLSVKTEIQKDPLTNRNDFELVNDFQGLQKNKGMPNGNKRKYTDIKETYTKFGKNVPNNLKRPKKSSSNDSRHGRKEKEIIGESRKLTLKISDTCSEGPKEEKEKTQLVLMKENWVQCDACEKWRLLPFGVEPSSFPKKWFCRMLYWLWVWAVPSKLCAAKLMELSNTTCSEYICNALGLCSLLLQSSSYRSIFVPPPF